MTNFSHPSNSQPSSPVNNLDLSAVPIVFEDQADPTPDELKNFPLIVVPPPEAFASPPPPPPLAQARQQPTIPLSHQTQKVLQQIEAGSNDASTSIGSIVIRRVSKQTQAPHIQPATVTTITRSQPCTATSTKFSFNLPSSMQVRKVPKTLDSARPSPIILNRLLCKKQSDKNPTTSTQSFVITRPSTSCLIRVPQATTSTSIIEAKEKTQKMQNQVLRNTELLKASMKQQTQNMSVVYVNIPFEYNEGNRVHKFNLTRVTAPTQQKSIAVIESCHQLKEYGSQGAIQLNALKASFPEFEHRDLLLQGFSDHEIKISKMRHEYKLYMLAKAIEKSSAAQIVEQNESSETSLSSTAIETPVCQRPEMKLLIGRCCPLEMLLLFKRGQSLEEGSFLLCRGLFSVKILDIFSTTIVECCIEIKI